MGHSYQQYLPTSAVQRFVDALWISESTVMRMSRLAHNLHYADQAHFIRDFTSLAGVTPGAYQLEHEN